MRNEGAAALVFVAFLLRLHRFCAAGSPPGRPTGQILHPMFPYQAVRDSDSRGGNGTRTSVADASFRMEGLVLLFLSL